MDREGNLSGSVKAEDSQDGHISAWKRAIYRASSPLLMRGSIAQSYVQCIIERLIEAGPYMFVTDDLILAHASPEDGVKHVDFSIGLIPDGILFEQGRKARAIFCLAVEDQQKHMGILQDIRKSLAKPQQIDELVRTGDPHEVCEILRRRLIKT